MVGKPQIHIPSLALDNPLAVDGVLRRPYEMGAGEGPDASAEQNDTDSLSAYEDACAETPELDRPFPVETEDPAEIGEGKNQKPKPGEQCLLS